MLMLILTWYARRVRILLIVIEMKQLCDTCGSFDHDFGDYFIDERENGSSDNDKAHEQEDDCCNGDDDDYEDCCDYHFGGEVHGDFDYELTIGKKAALDGAHFFAMDLANDGSLRSVFWADGRSREAYL
ncbi:hypothetical protein RJ639_001395 [Escallonia herrerae]|uniref:Protein FAR1-RELATED SEQUENCE n=1 Tax=Escallonia herrerae TaxID=1293975 RepID=A0AA89BHJ3_9ASTE|nr:hypothetical protein RJ639_001395 [Escallonia herrerae]